MKESKIFGGVRVAIVKFITLLFVSSSAINISAESEDLMITNNSYTLEYSYSSLNVDLATDSSLPYLYDGN